MILQNNDKLPPQPSHDTLGARTFLHVISTEVWSVTEDVVEKSVAVQRPDLSILSSLRDGTTRDDVLFK